MAQKICKENQDIFSPLIFSEMYKNLLHALRDSGLAVSLSGKIRVNSISPSWINTSFTKYTGADATQHLHVPIPFTGTTAVIPITATKMGDPCAVHMDFSLAGSRKHFHYRAAADTFRSAMVIIEC